MRNLPARFLALAAVSPNLVLSLSLSDEKGELILRASFWPRRSRVHCRVAAIAGRVRASG
jgi:hypothetical protein